LNRLFCRLSIPQAAQFARSSETGISTTDVPTRDQESS